MTEKKKSRQKFSEIFRILDYIHCSKDIELQFKIHFVNFSKKKKIEKKTPGPIFICNRKNRFGFGSDIANPYWIPEHQLYPCMSLVMRPLHKLALLHFWHRSVFVLCLKLSYLVGYSKNIHLNSTRLITLNIC